MKGKLTTPVRLMSLVAGLLLIPAIFLPLWRIDLVAPQYPEGLYMLIYASKLGGNVEIINGLNHYIGMRELHADDFPEFRFLPYVFAVFAFAGLLTAWINKVSWFRIYTLVYLLFCLLAMADFYRWEYDYGHNLNPGAAIIVPGMSYQPPLIGVKQLLNFTAYSFPAIGGYLLMGAALLLLAAWWMQWKATRSKNG